MKTFKGDVTMTRILRTFCPGSGLIAFGLLVSMFSLGVLKEEAKANCDISCGSVCSATSNPNGGVVCPAGSCTGFFCYTTCACGADRFDTGCLCQ